MKSATDSEKNLEPITFLSAEQVDAEVIESKQKGIVMEVDTFNQMSGDGDTI